MNESRTSLHLYELLREDLYDKFSNEGIWGNQDIWGNHTSGKRLGVLCELEDFLEKSEELLMLDEEFEEKIFEENVKLLLGKLMPLPRKLRESMLGMDPVQSYTEKYFQLRE